MKKLLALTILITIFTGNYALAFSPQYGISNGLIGYWSMDSRFNNWSSATAGTTFDSSGNNNTGTFTNMSKSTSQSLGKIRQGLTLDGTNDYVNIPNSSSINTPTQMTVSIWVKSSFSTFMTLASKANPYPDGWIMYWDASDASFRYKFDVGWSGAVGAWKVDPVIDATNKWVMLTATYDGSSVSNLPVMYINGTRLATPFIANVASGTRTSDAGASLTIGRYSGGAYLNGSVDEFRFYNRILSDSEVQALYRLGLAGNGR